MQLSKWIEVFIVGGGRSLQTVAIAEQVQSKIVSSSNLLVRI